jgi:hypothetical protein
VDDVEEVAADEAAELESPVSAAAEELAGAASRIAVDEAADSGSSVSVAAEELKVVASTV